MRSQTSEGPASTKKPVIGENSLPSLHKKIFRINLDTTHKTRKTLKQSVRIYN